MPEDTRIDVLEHIEEFSFEPLQSDTELQGFSNEYPDYTAFLFSNAKRMDSTGVTRTYLLYNAQHKICAYVSLLPGTIEVNRAFKSEFSTIDFPNAADKIGTIHIHHLAGDFEFCKEYRHIIKLTVEYVRTMIVNHINKYLNVCFISLDADINTDPDLEEKYKAAGFVSVGYNGELPLMVCPVYG